jgi:hypothetical protein
MTDKFKNFLGVYIICLHFAIVLLLIYERLSGGFEQDEFSTLLGITLPMFGGFAATIIRYFSVHHIVSKRKSTKELTVIFRVLSCALPGLFAGIVIVSIELLVYNKAFKNFEDAKTFILSVESIFAVSCGVLIYSIFHKDPDPVTPVKTKIEKNTTED